MTSGKETGLDYFGARYYSSSQGRFTSPDEFKGGGLLDPFTGQSAETIGPLPYADISDPQTLNKYAYVRNNPLRYVDPDGHCIEDLCIGEAIAVTALATATVNYLNSPQGQQSIAATLTLAGTALDKAADALGNLIFSKTSPGNTNAQPKQETTTATPSGPEPPKQGEQEQKEGAQDKKLSSSEVKTLEKNTGQSVHDIKGDIVGDKGVSRYDLYKTKGGDIVVKPKGGSGTGEPTGYTTEHLKHLPE